MLRGVNHYPTGGVGILHISLISLGSDEYGLALSEHPLHTAQTAYLSADCLHSKDYKYWKTAHPVMCWKSVSVHIKGS